MKMLLQTASCMLLLFAVSASANPDLNTPERDFMACWFVAMSTFADDPSLVLTQDEGRAATYMLDSEFIQLLGSGFLDTSSDLWQELDKTTDDAQAALMCLEQ